MKECYANAHMRVALIYADLSHCKKRKVGCVIVTTNNDIVIGYNGTPPNTCNHCEDKYGNTLPHVIHAEHNAIKKLEHRPELLRGSSVFVTYGTCIQCTELLIKYEVKELYYGAMQTKQEEIDFLNQSGIKGYYLPIEHLK